MSETTNILCIGEVLWDALPSGLYLGGAPLNVCYHLNQFGIDSAIASRVGDDRLGREALRRIQQLGIPADLVQVDSREETGFVLVELTAEGDPQYEILEPVSWDYIEYTDLLKDKARASWGVVFGSLAQRGTVSRNTVQQLWNLDLQLVFDMNLRPPFINRNIIHDSLLAAGIVKMNEAELGKLAGWYSLSSNIKNAVEALAGKFDCSAICITRGEKGALLFYHGNWIEHNGFPVDVRDAVGAGDAFLAALLYGMLKEKEGKELLAFANATGSLIAQKDGATPEYSLEDVLNKME